MHAALKNIVYMKGSSREVKNLETNTVPYFIAHMQIMIDSSFSTDCALSSFKTETIQVFLIPVKEIPRIYFCG